MAPWPKHDCNSRRKEAVDRTWCKPYYWKIQEGYPRAQQAVRSRSGPGCSSADNRMAFLIRGYRWLLQPESAVSVTAGIRIAAGPGGKSGSKREWLSIQHRKQANEPKKSAATPSRVQSIAQITGTGTRNTPRGDLASRLPTRIRRANYGCQHP